MRTIHSALELACADLRPGTGDDAVCGVRPDFVGRPATIGEVSDLIRAAAAHELTVVPRGSGSTMDAGVPPRRCDLVVDLSGLDRIIDHAAADMVLRVEAGVTMARIAERTAAARQQLAVDTGEPAGTRTIGGVLSMGRTGTRRYRYGAVRDLLLGVTMVRADGVVSESGGRVVKNVAGYDLGKLLTGAQGTLGIVVSATFRLHPLPAATRYVTTTVDDADTAELRRRAVLDANVDATAIDVDREGTGPIRLLARLDGTEAGTAARAETVAAVWGGGITDTPPDWHGRLPGADDDIRCGLAILPTELSTVCEVIDTAGVDTVLRGSLACGDLQLSLPADTGPDVAARLIDTVRAAAARRGGRLTVDRAPEPVRDRIDMWGPIDSGALTLMRRVKDRFDPGHRLSPGRFVGGI